jgi:lipid-A-disaccharide synthase
MPSPSSDIHAKVLITGCEASADMHAASLIRAVNKLEPGIRFVGLAGPLMRQAGCDAVDDLTTRSAMLLGAVGSAGYAARALWRVGRLLRTGTVDAAVLIDSPTLNLPLARRCKGRSLPVMYYVAPQVWAWGNFRLGKIRRRVDRLACILPFEEPFFQGHGIDAVYVGHPLFDRLLGETLDVRVTDRLREGGKPVVALLPGSRRHVVSEILPGQLEVAAAIAREFPPAKFLVSAANDQVAPLIDEAISHTSLPVRVCKDERAEMIAAADLALVASGTTTLEVAYHGTPMIVMYNASRWGYQLIGRWLIRTRYLSLVNVLAGRELVPEFMPYYRSTEPIAQAAIEMLLHPHRLERTATELKELIEPLAKPGASAAAAEVLLEILRPAQR